MVRYWCGVPLAVARLAMGTYGDTLIRRSMAIRLSKATDFTNLAIGISILSASDTTVEQNTFKSNDDAVLVDDSFGPPSGDFTTDVIHDNGYDLSNTVAVVNTTPTRQSTPPGIGGAVERLQCDRQHRCPVLIDFTLFFTSAPFISNGQGLSSNAL